MKKKLNLKITSIFLANLRKWALETFFVFKQLEIDILVLK